LTVSVTAAVAGAPQIGLGDALGSNIVNVAVILGIVLSISAIQVPRHKLKRDFVVALSTPALTGVLLLDGVLSRVDGVLLLSLFVMWLFAVMVDAREQRRGAPRVTEAHRGVTALILSTVGLASLVIAGRLIVGGASGIAHSLGIDQFIVGATFVALGTSAPEIATVIIAKVHGHDEVSLGTILGSNIFNGLFIVAIAAIISSIPADRYETGIALVFGLFALALVYPGRADVIERRQGVLLLILYAGYLFVLSESLFSRSTES
jgi:cation:H+ antiporter